MKGPPTYGSVCSGIEAATCAWHPLGWKPLWLSEIEPFACALLAHHHPAVPNLGDMTTIADRVRAREVPAPDVLVGGTPCQSFSVAGLRGGLDDPRGQLARSFVEILDAIDSVRPGDPGIALWENVPGVLTDDDNAFGNLLAALVGEDRPLVTTGGRWSDAGAVLGPARRAAWRVLDARHFGLPQRRRRVLLVVGAHAGPVDPVEVLLVEPDLRDPAPTGRRTRTHRATRPRGRTPLAGGGREPDPPHGRDGDREEGPRRPWPFAFDAYNYADADVTHTLRRGRGNGTDDAIPITLDGRGVRRLTPLEYERLQGFPEGHTLVPWRGRAADDCPDDPRYRALGNSMAVPVMNWIGRRIDAVRAGQRALDDVPEPGDVFDLFG
jgi:DNA (cytosine-5)-methyltransferase 1